MLLRNFVSAAEVSDGLLRVHHHPQRAEIMQKLHSGHQVGLEREGERE